LFILTFYLCLSSFPNDTYSFFFFYFYGDHRYLHSFPTRRSSDLALETALHHALAQYRLDVDIRAGNGKIIHPREWFIVDLNTINNLVSQIISKLQMDL